MPIYDPTLRAKLIQLGHDPDAADYADSGQAPQQPTINSPQDQPSNTGSFLRSAARAFPSVAGGLAAGAKATALSSPLAAIPVAGPFIPPAIGIGTGILTAMGVRKAQDSLVLPNVLSPEQLQAYQRSESSDREVNPVASTAGEIAASGPFLAPSLKALPGAVRALGNPLRGIKPNQADLGNLLNVGLGGAVPTATRYAADPEVTGKELLLEALGGVLMNRSTKLGQKIGLPKDVYTPSTDARPTLRNGTPIEQVPVAPGYPDFIGPREIQGPPLPDAGTLQRQLFKNQVNKLAGKRLLQEEEIPGPTDAILKSRRVEDINAGLAKQGLPDKPTQEYQDFFKNLGIKQKIITQDVPVYGDREQQVRGEALPRRGTGEATIKLNPNKAELDTAPHEQIHVKREDLKNLGDEGDKKLVSRGDKIIEESPAYQEWKAARDLEGNSSTVDEFATTLGGEDSVRRVLRTDGKGEFRNWLKDVESNWRIKFGKGRVEDVSRMSSNRLVNDPDFDVNYKTGQTVKPVAETSVEQDDTGIAKQAPVKDRIEFKNKDGSVALVQHTLVEDIKDASGNVIKPKGSTVSEKSLQELGYNKFQDDAGTKLSDTPDTTPAKPAPAKEEPKARTVPVLRPEVEKVRSIKSPAAKPVAEGMTKFYERFTENKGRLVNEFDQEIRSISDLDNTLKAILTQPKAYLDQTTPELSSAWKKMQQVRNGEKVTFTPAEEAARKVIRKSLDKVRDIQRAEYPGIRTVGENDPDYVPHVTKFSSVNEVLTNPDSLKSKQLRADLINYQTGKLKSDKLDEAGAREIATKNFDTLVKGYNKKDTDIASQFGPLDKAEGIGLPVSWREQNPILAMERYLDRVSRRFAYADAFEKGGPDLLKQVEHLGANEHVSTVMNNIKGIHPQDEPLRNSLMGVVRAANLGPLTGARDFAANLVLGFQHHQNPVQSVTSAIHALTNMKENLADAYKSGRIRTHMNDLEWGDTTSVLKRTRDILGDIQGRNFLEKITRATAMGQGKFVTLDFLEQQSKGNLSKTGKKWFEDFGKDVDWKKGTLTKDELLKIAGRYVDSVQGTYDYRGLPKIAMEGTYSPLLALARWNIEKANNFQKFVINPAMQGNIKPLLMSTLGMILGGTPKFSELKAASELGADVKAGYLYKFLGLSSAAGYAGMLGDVAKGVMDKMYAKNKPRWYNNMLLDTAQNTANTIGNLYDAISEEGFNLDLVADAVGNIVEDNLQMYRIILTHTSNDVKDKLEDSNSLRDLRMFRTLTGEKVTDYTTTDYSEKIAGKDMEKFKKTEDINEAASLLPKLLEDAFEKTGNNPEKLKSELTKIKMNSFQSMPSPDTMPYQFTKHLMFLEKSQGKEKAAQTLNEYLNRRAINKAKSSMVP